MVELFDSGWNEIFKRVKDYTIEDGESDGIKRFLSATPGGIEGLCIPRDSDSSSLFAHHAR